MEISGKSALVAGGASGLGEATVRAYAARGAQVAILDFNESRGQALAAELGPDVCFHLADVSDGPGVESAIETAMAELGALHICNNFAGVALATRTLGRDGPHPLDTFSRVIHINLVGTFNISRLAAKYMSMNTPDGDYGSRGVIINTASVAAFEGQVGQAAYSASKGGVVSMTLPMARDLAAVGIRVNTIVPGLIHTPLCDGMPDELYESLTSAIVFPKRMGRPEEVAKLSVDIVENDFINGECIRIDGAMRLQPR
jgi:NAD(P)-dependent dehydrogenase (short-subunit alcohol dehydrogenase family)